MSEPCSITDNRLLAILHPADRATLERQLEFMELPVGLALYEPDQPIESVYFVGRGMISMVASMDRGTVEVATVGREGMLGVPVLLHSPSMTSRAFVQVPGYGWRCPAEALLAVTAERPAVGRLLLRYVQALYDQVSQSVACNRLHTLEERCARWLLMVRDQAGDDSLSLKQAFLADMLGVHRPAVTLAVGALQTAGLIRQSRGRIHLLDRQRLEGAACPCYGIVRDRFARLQQA